MQQRHPIEWLSSRLATFCCDCTLPPPVSTPREHLVTWSRGLLAGHVVCFNVLSSIRTRADSNSAESTNYEALGGVVVVRGGREGGIEGEKEDGEGEGGGV